MDNPPCDMSPISAGLRPNGYLHIRTSRPGWYTVYQCEIELRSSKSEAVTFTFELIQVSRLKRTYCILLYENNKRSSFILSAQIKYINRCGGDIALNVQIGNSQFCCVYDALLRFLHSVIYHDILVTSRTNAERVNGKVCSEWNRGFTDSVTRSIEEHSPYSAQELVFALKDLLHR